METTYDRLKREKAYLKQENISLKCKMDKLAKQLYIYMIISGVECIALISLFILLFDYL